jgi:hypothetical protein
MLSQFKDEPKSKELVLRVYITSINLLHSGHSLEDIFTEIEKLPQFKGRDGKKVENAKS